MTNHIPNLRPQNNSCEVYVVGYSDPDDECWHYVKIGIAVNGLSRMRELQTANPRELEMYAIQTYWSRDIAYGLEQTLHKVMAPWRLRGEWFRLCDRDIWRVTTILDMMAGA